MLYEPPPQVNKFQWIWQRWLYGFWQKFSDLASTDLDDNTKGFHLVYYPLSTAESAAGVTPVNYEYPYNHVFRFIPSNLHAGIRARTNTTNLSSYIQNAILASTHVWFPVGEYLLETSIEWRPYRIIEGENWHYTVFSSPTLTTPMFYDNATGAYSFQNSEIKNLAFEGNESQTGNHIFKCTQNTYNVVFQRCQFRGCGGDALHFEGDGSPGLAQWVKVEDCKFGGDTSINVKGYGLYAYGTFNNGLIARNSFASSILSSIYLEGTATNFLENNTILSNNIEYSLSDEPVGAVRHSVYLSSYVVNTTIQGNYLEGAGPDNGSYNTAAAAIYIDGANNTFTIKDNLFASNPFHVKINDALGGSIENNWFTWNGTYPSAGDAQYYIQVSDTSGTMDTVYFHGNHIHNTSYPWLNDLVGNYKLQGYVDPASSVTYATYPRLRGATMTYEATITSGAGAPNHTFKTKNASGVSTTRFAITGYENIATIDITNAYLTLMPTGNAGTLTLNANQTTTSVSNTNVTANSYIVLFPTSATAAADLAAGNVYVSAKTAGTSFTITHPNNANADKTFDYLMFN